MVISQSQGKRVGKVSKDQLRSWGQETQGGEAQTPSGGTQGLCFSCEETAPPALGLSMCPHHVWEAAAGVEWSA